MKFHRPMIALALASLFGAAARPIGWLRSPMDDDAPRYNGPARTGKRRPVTYGAGTPRKKHKAHHVNHAARRRRRRARLRGRRG